MCPGYSHTLDKVARARKGHVLQGFLLEDGATGIFCLQCGAYSSSKARALMKPCLGLQGPNPSHDWWHRGRWPTNHRIRVVKRWSLDGAASSAQLLASSSVREACSLVGNTAASKTESLWIASGQVVTYYIT